MELEHLKSERCKMNKERRQQLFDDAIGCHPRLSRRGRIDITQELNQRGADEGVIMYHLQPRINTTVILNSSTPIEQYGRIKRSNKRKNK